MSSRFSNMPSYVTRSNSLSYVADTIGSLSVPVVVGKVKDIPCAMCTSGEWAIRLQHVSGNCFRLDVTSFTKKTITFILTIDPAVSPNGRFNTLMKYFNMNMTADLCDTDYNSIPFFEELYYEFPIRELFNALNEFCNHALDGLDVDFSRPSNTIITASARQFLSSRKECSCRENKNIRTGNRASTRS